MMVRLLHWLAHALRWNYGRVETWHERGRLMVGFRCDGCGQLQDAHESTLKMPTRAATRTEETE